MSSCSNRTTPRCSKHHDLGRDRLQTDHIDLYQYHRPDVTTDMEETLSAVEQLVPLAEKAGLSLTHMALAFVLAHPGVTSAFQMSYQPPALTTASLRRRPA
jgi:aryl-alcohol dehydrogenase-like predicted oxidoreductase